ncbi:MAG: polysaccharide ABC transporter ATP-binding protein [Leptolyngbyaceae cyanobacterium bins.59]|nr:polysaccharide ABC transporter ATP-binding protein [Leptolyngbyaceae cyanobacterium bins.59]
MADLAIRVEELSKRYVLSHRARGQMTLRETLSNALSFQRSKPWNLQGKRTSFQEHEEFWALKNLSFEVRQGDRVGIIGRNGAGKSTLLKVISRITEPTKGRIKIRGRVASLLEVGTGFHPELTGRENIYLNGAILGMSRAEISRKFDEIVAFAEVERFLDTPVKRYSSGMYVRLAFAVAAYLEPEILIVDEVLAVGDVQFQQKCLGKMEDVATREGRTVLFVSHNLQAVAQLTNRCIVLSHGECKFDGPTDQGVMTYLLSGKSEPDYSTFYQAPPGKSGNYLVMAQVHPSDPNGLHCWGESIAFEFILNIDDPQPSLCFSFQVVDSQQQPVTHNWIYDSETAFGRQKGQIALRCVIPKLRLFMGSYTVTIWFAERRQGTIVETITHLCPFNVTMAKFVRQDYEWRPNECVYIEDAQWEIHDL